MGPMRQQSPAHLGQRQARELDALEAHEKEPERELAHRLEHCQSGGRLLCQLCSEAFAS